MFAIAHDLGAVNAASAPVVFSVGHYRDPAVQYIVANNQLQARRLAFWSRYSSTNDAVSIYLAQNGREGSLINPDLGFSQ